MSPNIYGQLTFNQVPRLCNRKRIVSSINGAVIIRYSHAKEWHLLDTKHPSWQSLLRCDTKSTSNKSQINWSSSKLHSFVHQRTLSRKWQDNPQTGENIFTSCDKDLVRLLYKELNKLKIIKIRKNQNRYFPTYNVQLSNMHINIAQHYLSSG